MDKQSRQQLNQDMLQNMAVPTASFKPHQVHLKQALLAASRPQPTTKNRWSNFMTKPKFIMSGAAIAVVVLALVGFSIFTIQKPVSAAELTQKSLAKVSGLSPSEFHDLDLRVNGNPKAELEAAKQAKDLVVMTYDEYIQQDTNGIVTQAPDSPESNDHSGFNPKDLQYLRYTDSEGVVHTIGINKDGLPVMIMAFRNNKDGSSQGSLRVEGGISGHGILGGGTAGPGPGAAGMTTCSMGSGGQPVCTNSDGSPAPAPECQTMTDGGVRCSAGARVNTNR